MAAFFQLAIFNASDYFRCQKLGALPNWHMRLCSHWKLSTSSAYQLNTQIQTAGADRINIWGKSTYYKVELIWSLQNVNWMVILLYPQFLFVYFCVWELHHPIIFMFSSLRNQILPKLCTNPFVKLIVANDTCCGWCHLLFLEITILQLDVTIMTC